MFPDVPEAAYVGVVVEIQALNKIEKNATLLDIFMGSPTTRIVRGRFILADPTETLEQEPYFAVLRCLRTPNGTRAGFGGRSSASYLRPYRS